MRPSKLLVMFTVLGFLVCLISCDNAAKKVDKAEENVVDAEKELMDAKEEYIADIEQYRLLAAEKIATNNKSISEFNARIESEKKSVSADYRAKIVELEQKNSDMKKKLDDYQVDGKEKWEIFKKEFGEDMDALGNAINNFGKKSN